MAFSAVWGKTLCKITGRLQSGLDLVVPYVYKFQGKEKLPAPEGNQLLHLCLSPSLKL